MARQRCCRDGLRSAEGDRLQRALDCLPHFIHRVSMFKQFLHSTQGIGKWFLVKWPTPQSLSHIGPVITQRHVKMNQRRGAKVCDGRRPDHGLKPVAHNKHRGLRGEQPESSHEQTSSQTAHQAAQLMCFARLHCFSLRQAGSRRAMLVRVITPQAHGCASPRQSAHDVPLYALVASLASVHAGFPRSVRRSYAWVWYLPQTVDLNHLCPH